MKRLLTWSAAMILIFTLLVISVRVSGGPAKSSKPTVAKMLAADSYLGPHGWCWRDICPGQTLTANAVVLLQEFNKGFIKQVRLDNNEPYYYWTSVIDSFLFGKISGGGYADFFQPVDRITIDVSDGSMRLSDAIDLYGIPIAIDAAWGSCYQGDNDGYLWGSIYFPNGVWIFVHTPRPSLKPVRITLEMRVAAISYLDMDQIKGLNSVPWSGFTWLHSSYYSGYLSCAG